MRIIRWSVDNPGPVAALWGILLVLAGLALFWWVPTRLMPAVSSPLLAVVTRAAGLPSQDVEATITGPLEEQLVHLPGLRATRSASMTGMSVVTLEFPYGQDMHLALQEVRGQLADVGARLGLDGQRGEWPRVMAYDPLNLPVLRVALQSPNLDPQALRTLADETLVPKLQALPGVASVYVVGGAKRHVDVAASRDRLAAFGLSILDLRKALEAGQVEGQGATLSSLQGLTAVRLQASERLSNLVVGRVGKRDILVRDVAIVSTEAVFESQGMGHTLHGSGSTYRLNGQDAVEVNIVSRLDASCPQVIARVRAQLEEIKRGQPGLVVEEAYDNTHFIDRMEQDVLKELAVAVLLTGLVVFVFLGDLRGTLIALVTLPASLSCAVLLFAPLGLSLNSSSLVGLLLAIGRLVDDAIVDLSSVHRHLRLGKPARAAAIDGCSEVRRAVISATVIVCLALVPTTVCGGLTQDMFVGIVWPFLLSLAASLLVALTLTPMLASLAYRGAEARPEASWLAGLHRLERAYGRGLGWALEHRALVISAALGVCYLAAMLFPFIGSEMMPMADIAQAYGTIEARPGCSTDELSRVVAEIEKLLLEHKEVLKVSTELGQEHAGSEFTGYDMGGPLSARLMITLTDRDTGRAPIWTILDQVRHQAEGQIPNLRRLTLQEMGSDVMASAMAPIEILVYGPQLERVSWLSESIARMGRDMPDLSGAGTAWGWGQPELRVQVQAQEASALGLSPLEVARQTYFALNGGVIEVPSGPPILLSYAEDQRRNPDDVQNALIVGPDGRSAPLSQLARIESGEGPTMIMHDNLRRVNSVCAFYRPGGRGSMPLTMELMMKAAMDLAFPPGYGLEQRGDMTGMMDSFDRLLRGLGLALMLIYLALVWQFRSLLVPLTLMAAIPLELTGVFLALMLAHQTFSTVSLLGIVVLNGMDVTASILLIDRALQLGSPRREAVLEGGRTRLLPILMTVAVTLAVMVPLAFHPAAGLDAYSPLATVIVGGLIMSTPLTLLVVPVLYTLLDDLAVRWNRRR